MEARGLSKSFHGRPVLKSVDFTLDAGEIAVLIGKSGSGKSTLLRLVAGLTKPDAGDVDMMGEHVILEGEYEPPWRAARGKVGMIFQSYTLWPHMNVLENLSLAPRKVLNESPAEITKRAERALSEVGMAHHLNSRSTQLSGGERQRVAIARALMMRPKLLLCDEMTSALDPPVAAEVLGVITKLKEEEGIACILVTHDMAFAAKAADRVAFFENGVIAEVTHANYLPTRQPRACRDLSRPFGSKLTVLHEGWRIRSRPRQPHGSVRRRCSFVVIGGGTWERQLLLGTTHRASYPSDPTLTRLTAPWSSFRWSRMARSSSARSSMCWRRAASICRCRLLRIASTNSWCS
jgi:ABC-type polar amino acid transport system ATPase subunit